MSSTKLPDTEKEYEERTEEIIKRERAYYLTVRRAQNGLEPPTDDNLVGMCISGGGVRSATLGLGMLQAFIKAGKLKTVDYLSTVSGGGFIGSCLTSLLSNEHTWFDKKGNIEAKNYRFNGAMTGVDPHNSPFVDLNKGYEYAPLEDTVLSSKHQLHHLRRFGEYLTPRKKIFSWDVRRAVGALTGGIVVNVMMFVLLVSVAVLLHHSIFGWLSKDAFMSDLRHAESPVSLLRQLPASDTIQCLDSIKLTPQWAALSAQEKIGVWRSHRFDLQLYLIGHSFTQELWLCLLFLGAGALAGFFFLWWSRSFPYKIAWQTEQERRFHLEKNPDGKISKVEGQEYDREGGENIETLVTGKYRFILGVTSYFMGPVLAFLVVGLIQNYLPLLFGQFGYMVFLTLPFCFNLGMFAMVHFLSSFYYINQGRERVSGRLYRDFLHGIQGSVMLGLLVTAVFPLVVILLFGKHSLSIDLLFSFIPVAAAYYFTLQGVTGKSTGSGVLTQLAHKLQTPLLNLSIFLFTAFAFAWLSGKLYSLERWVQNNYHISYTESSIWLFVGAVVFLLFLGFVANTNDLSLHYFFRDRLAEAYLRTDGRVSRPKPTDGMPGKKDLFDANIRNHDNLPLRDVGEGNNRGPYHLIVAALNLQGSHDLSKKTLKSDHFIFSKYYIGSRTTGYYRTDRYYDGNTKLATAMTVSAAAISSGMGAIGFAASNFYMTLLNLRTGYWMLNPAFAIREKCLIAARKTGQKVKMNFYEKWSIWMPSYPFWLGYLAAEFTGYLSYKTKRVYVSDGGHTGDNLGLLPLVQRKCKTIYIGDFEEDKGFSFASFNQAVRLAQAVYDARIEIDLQPLMPRKGKNDLTCSLSSAVKGRIIYDDNSVGNIIYMKSSMSIIDNEHTPSEPNAAQPASEWHQAPGSAIPAPVLVMNYFKTNPTFPHQPTSDQYFDEAQFEAHRMLGEHIGQQAIAITR